VGSFEGLPRANVRRSSEGAYDEQHGRRFRQIRQCSLGDLRREGQVVLIDVEEEWLEPRIACGMRARDKGKRRHKAKTAAGESPGTQGKLDGRGAVAGERDLQVRLSGAGPDE